MKTPTPVHFATSTRDSPRAPAGLLAGLLAGIALLGLASGCNTEYTCADLGCDPGYRCDLETEECIQKDDDCERGGCPTNQICNVESGNCEPETKSCGESGTCPEGQVCDGTDGFCVTEPGCQSDDCGAAERCDTDSGACVPRSCDADGECPRGYICGRTTGTCIAGCRDEQSRCPSGQRCWGGQCLSNCGTDRDCPHGQYCATDGNESVCRPEGPCDTDDDCRRSDEVCRNGSCTAPPCQSDDDCASNRVCDRGTGLCVGGDCSDDSFAPNQTRSEATSLEFETYTGLQLCPGKSDWFQLEAESAESVAIRLEHPAETDIDMTVFTDDGDVAALNHQAPSRARGTASTSVSFVSERAQTLVLRVFSEDRVEPSDGGERRSLPIPASAGYELQVERAEEFLCRDDRFEENDARAEAETLPSDVGSAPAYPFLKICGGDTDWFRLPEMQNRAQLEAELRNAPGHVELEILAEHGARFERPPNEPFHLWRNASRQDWFFRVSSNRRQSTGYNLTYAVDSPWQCPEAGAYGDADHALALAPDTRTTYLLCPVQDGWEDDWIALQPPTSDTYLDVQVFERAGSPPLEVTLFEKKEDSLSLLRAAEGRQGVHGAALEVDTSQEIVVRIVGASEPGTLVEKPEYDVVYGYENDSE